MMSRTSRFSLLLGLGVAASILLLRGEDGPLPAPEDSSANSSMDSPVYALQESLSTRAVPAVRELDEAQVEYLPSDVPTAEQELRKFWGADWESARQRLLEKGHDLTLPLELAPWEDVLPVVEDQLAVPEGSMRERCLAQMGWPVTLTEDWVREHYRVGEDVDSIDLAAIESMASPFHRDLEPLVEQFLGDLDTVVRHHVRLGRIERSPLSTDALPQSRSKFAFYAGAVAVGGWAVKVKLHSEEYPELLASVNQISEIRRRRDHQIKRSLSQQ